eukprot:Em0009g28a
MQEGDLIVLLAKVDSTWYRAVNTETDDAEVSADELTFKGGELIIFKSRVSSDWLRGELLNGSEGIFPTNFVENVLD